MLYTVTIVAQSFASANLKIEAESAEDAVDAAIERQYDDDVQDQFEHADHTWEDAEFRVEITTEEEPLETTRKGGLTMPSPQATALSPRG